MMRLLCSALVMSILLDGHAQAMTGETAIAHFILTLSGPSSVKSGRDVSIAVYLKNASQATISGGRVVSGDEAIVSNSFIVRGPDSSEVTPKTKYEEALEGRSASPNPLYMSFSRRHVDVAPGEMFLETGNISHFFNMTKPGRYTIRIRNRLLDGFYVDSNSISVLITP